ncbi:MAG TPA: thermonuclease family protein [Bacteroidales bacterium]|nr:thermonuclease family protein [Bacteroidales bacterium]
MKRLFHIAVALLFLGSCTSSISPPVNELYSVTRVVDGDTFWAYNPQEGEIKIRLIGLDAPEIHKTAKKNIGYYGTESTRYLEQLVGGKNVRLEFDAGKYDRYKRVLAYVYLEDGTFVNAELIRQGYATVLTVPPNVKYADEFVKLQRKARRSGRGMWGKS